MRVIAGHLRSRTLVAPAGAATRPTSDRLRETLFNVLAPRLPNARFADLYAGSGAVGIEALSRGAAYCLFAERAPAALGALRKNLATLSLTPLVAVSPHSVARTLRDIPEPFDLIFLDPPYEAADEYTATLAYLALHHAALLAANALVIAEHARRNPLPDHYGPLTRTRLLPQGDAALSFYSFPDDKPHHDAPPSPDPR